MERLDRKTAIKTNYLLLRETSLIFVRNKCRIGFFVLKQTRNIWLNI